MLCYNKKETKANMKPWEQQEKENVNDLWKVSAKTHSLLLYPEASMLVKEKWGAWVKLSVNDRFLWTRAKKKINKTLTALSWLGYKLKVWKSEGDETINHA